MSQALLLVLQFLGEPTASEKMAIAQYERSRQTTVELKTRASKGSVPSLPTTTYPAYDADLVLRLEAELDAARTAAASLDERRALEILRGVEAALRAHPELPQSAWLMAERWRVAERVGDQPDAERVRFGARADALEGSRAVEFGAPDAASPEPVLVRAVVEGLSPRDRLEVDAEVRGREVTTRAGEHHVRVFRAERLLFAGWVTLGAGASALLLRVPELSPCSDEDLAGVRLVGTQARPEAGTRCARWAVARRERGGLSIAECFTDSCGPFSFYSARPRSVTPAAPPPQPAREDSSNVLLKVALGSAAVLATAAAILWQGGAFDPAPPAETRWVYGGARPAP